MKAIETEYKGYKFRSRLEARWAIFFDKLGVQWLYEPEGYLLNNGERYLPDFYFPKYDFFGEVKGFLDSTDERKLYGLVSSSKKPLILFDSYFFARGATLYDWFESDKCTKCSKWDPFCEHDKKYQAREKKVQKSISLPFWDFVDTDHGCFWYGANDFDIQRFTSSKPIFVAIRFARSARFEYESTLGN